MAKRKRPGTEEAPRRGMHRMCKSLPDGQAKTEFVETNEKLNPCKRKVACCDENPCGRILANSNSLYNHLKLMHNWSSNDLEKLKKYKSKSLPDGQAKEEFVETNEKLYPCNRKVACCDKNPCGKILANSNSLRNHLKLMHNWSSNDVKKLKDKEICKSPPDEQQKSECTEKNKKLLPSRKQRACCDENPCGKILAHNSSLRKHLKLIHDWSPDDLDKLRKKKMYKTPPDEQQKSEFVQKKGKLYPCNSKVACCDKNPCGKILANNRSLRKHLKLMHGWSPDDLEKLKYRKVVCCVENSCGKILANNSSLRKHLKLMHGWSPDDLEKLKHKNMCKPPPDEQPKSECTERSKKLFPCRKQMACCDKNPCGIILANKSNLLKHLRLVHDWGEDELDELKVKKKKICKLEKNCPNCGVTLANSSNLSRHLKRYCPKLFTEKIHKCSVCQEGFDFSADLKKHMITMHKSHSLFWCAYCTNHFTSADKLRVHVLVHLRKH